MTASRRGFLSGAASALALAATTRAVAAGGLTDRTVPGTGTNFKILEIFFAGGLSHRETWWVERPDERPVVRRLDALNPVTNPILRPVGAPADWTAWLPTMGAYTAAAHQVGTAGSRAIHLGPAGSPLVAGSSLLPRLRVVATGHDRAVHEIGQAYMLQGQPSSTARGRASGAGAAIARHSGLPSFVFYNSGMADSRSSAFAAAEFGEHGAENEPRLIPYDNPDIVALLGGARDPARDALSELYDADYVSGLTFRNPAAPAFGLRARSMALDRYLASIGAAFNGPALAAALGQLSATTGNTLWDNGTRRAIKASVELLAAGLSRYCCVTDAAVVGDDFGGFSNYDSHNVVSFDDHAAYTTGNVLNVLRTLREEIDAGRLDLSDTLVVFNSEFGRSFWEATGSHHCWRGFAVALLGGPIPPGAGGVVGDLPFTPGDDGESRETENPCDATGGLYDGPVTGTDLRAAVLQAAGIHPLQVGVFEQSETNTDPSLSRDAAADALAAHLFGV